MTKTIFGKKLLMLATITVLVTGLTLATTFDDAEAKKAKTTEVSVFSSSVPFDFVTGIFPIGGTGIDNPSDFVVDTTVKKDTAIQVGLKAHDRFGDMPLMDPIGNVYIAPTGDATAPGLAEWNFEYHVDGGTTYLEAQLAKELTPLNLKDFTLFLEIKDSAGNTFSGDINDGIDAFFAPTPVPTVLLAQGSQNIGFGFIGLPIDSDAYDISLTVSNDKGKKVAKSNITVLVTDEVPEDGKIDICHKGKKTINVSVNAITAHLKHGDTLGSCPE